jgi:hypothetical protein
MASPKPDPKKRDPDPKQRDIAVEADLTDEDLDDISGGGSNTTGYNNPNPPGP